MVEFQLRYPVDAQTHEIKTIKSGQLMFLVGANGAGKSTLMQHFAAQNHGRVRRITAHRQVWFNSNFIELTPASREQNERSILSQDQQAQARWRDDYAHLRSQVTIFDLIDSENVEARKIADAARAKNMTLVEQLAQRKSPMASLNDILQISNLPIRITVDQGSKLLAERDDSLPYSIAELSDGERNAILIIANVLTAPPNTLILLDEPERHLHRSIVSPLLSTLLSYREDCAFVISTHDVGLPLDQDKASALLVRSYKHNPQSWQVDYIDAVENLDEEVALAVLGSRRVILFVEGRSSSLDLQIYQILFPQITIKAIGSCVEIERIVSGLRSSENSHWISAIGLIDRDNRSDQECIELEKSGIFALRQYSIESIYYHPVTFDLMLKRISFINPINVEETALVLGREIVKVFNGEKQRLVARIVQRKARDELTRQAPDYKKILQGGCSVNFSFEHLMNEELAVAEKHIHDSDIAGIICRYPVRETQILEMIAKALHFQSRDKYEQAVRKMLIEDVKACDILKDFFNPITAYL